MRERESARARARESQVDRRGVCTRETERDRDFIRNGIPQRVASHRAHQYMPPCTLAPPMPPPACHFVDAFDRLTLPPEHMRTRSHTPRIAWGRRSSSVVVSLLNIYTLGSIYISFAPFPPFTILINSYKYTTTLSMKVDSKFLPAAAESWLSATPTTAARPQLHLCLWYSQTASRSLH